MGAAGGSRRVGPGSGGVCVWSKAAVTVVGGIICGAQEVGGRGEVRQGEWEHLKGWGEQDRSDIWQIERQWRGAGGGVAWVRMGRSRGFLGGGLFRHEMQQGREGGVNEAVDIGEGGGNDS